MEKLTKKQMLESLSRFRAASDLINDDLNKLLERVLSIHQSIDGKAEKTPEEEAIRLQLAGLVDLIIQSTNDSHKYNESMWKDYTQVIKALGASTEVKNHGD